MAAKSKILVVDDEHSVRWAFEKALQKVGYEVALAETGVKGIQQFKHFQPDLVLLDIRMPEMDGLQVLQKIRTLDPDAQVIVMTAYSDMETTVSAMKYGAYDFLSKPFNIEDCMKLIRGGLAARAARAEVSDELQLSETGGLKGSSPPMQEVYKLIGKVSAEDITVLVTGESGSGKELVAQAVHYNSNRSTKPFWAINCTAISESLMESELFGFEKGAFTGAIAKKSGVFELAQGGTLFLDEIGDMSLEMQAQLLRVLEERQIVRVGGSKRIKVDVRIIAATNKDLRSAIREGRFREDLYHRIKVIEIRLPALRERPTDIPLLARYFTQQLAMQRKVLAKVLSDDTIAALSAYTWPGNVRELRNVIEQACTLSRDKVILPDHLPVEIKAGLRASPGKGAATSNNDNKREKVVIAKPMKPAIGVEREPTNSFIGKEGEELSKTSIITRLVKLFLTEKISGNAHGQVLEAVEKELLIQALERFRSNQVQTANFLGITRNTLRSKIEKYKL